MSSDSKVGLDKKESSRGVRIGKILSARGTGTESKDNSSPSSTFLGREDVSDEKRSGRPTDENVDEFLPQGRTVNRKYYLQVMRNLREAIRQKSPDLWKNMLLLLLY
ncbi:unnamed protein product [Acanthoscelides obtectus]|uniref:Uncharacterized protein n=1 Tax=Acanthoscelides obtectus TaxID=200917 RepID=A0A9P0KZE6_ACAOB|nr:unnamed protein product [Acanthoscelides obtectus]CAK1630383.1 hypothetical protein AOBTE_LOCUS6292 [Acanthoscelides obtectus]